jgi:hypothetical protein
MSIRRKTQKPKTKPAARQTKKPAEGAVLCSRLQAAGMLGVSVPTLIRLEHKGVLTPLKLFPDTRNAAVRYRLDAIERLASGGDQ